MTDTADAIRGGVTVVWKGQTYRISEADYAAIQQAYYAVCDAEGALEAGAHYQLMNAFHRAGIRGLSKEDARKLGAQIC